jgi:hypothetical protein
MSTLHFFRLNRGLNSEPTKCIVFGASGPHNPQSMPGHYGVRKMARETQRSRIAVVHRCCLHSEAPDEAKIS